MKKLLMLTLVLAIVPMARGQITLEVYQADGETPFDCNDDLMVGTKLTLVVSSDSNNYWSGGLFIAGQDRAFCTLAGRDKDPNTRDWTASHYESAGDFAQVWAWQDSSIWGFDLYTFYPVDGNSDSNTTVAGEWFIIDYEADDVGDCNVGFYDYDVSWDDPNYYVSFVHVPTRDLNSDEVVNFEDFAMFSSEWKATDCNEPNWCSGADLDRNGNVDYNDLGLFVEYWLWPASPNEANEAYLEDPNIIYRIVDVNGSNDITIDVNDSVTLYVTKETNDVNIFIFYLEVDISDTNLGSIDNTECPNGTAQVLASPRDPSFDYWGPGLEQEEGIQLCGGSLSSLISDGNLASFVFTCEGQGDLTLELLNWDSLITPTLEGIIIHQVDPNSQRMMGMGGGMEEMLDTEEIQQPQPAQQEIDEMVSWLEDLRIQEEQIRETYSEADWNEFIGSIKNSYP